MMPVAAMASDGGALELAAGSASLTRDVTDVLDATGFVPPAVVVLADRARLALQSAVREAAGRPHDDRWYAAYDALRDFTIFYRRCAPDPDGVPSFARLAKFLAENADLAGASIRPPHRFGRAFTHFSERS